MATVSDLVHASLREIGVLAAGQVATADDAQVTLDALGRLQDKWNIERLYTYTVTRTTFTITQAASFTIGSGATINTPRPDFIDDVRLVDTSPDPDIEIPLYRLYERDYREIPDKALTAALPSSWYYSATYPTGTLYLFPIPTQSLLQGAVYAATPVTKYTSLATAVSLPPGYEELIVSNLAVRIAPTFEKAVSPSLADAARTSMAAAKRINRRPARMRFEAAALVQRGGYNILTDRWGRE